MNAQLPVRSAHGLAPCPCGHIGLVHWPWGDCGVCDFDHWEAGDE